MNKPKFRVWDNVDYMSKPFTLNELQAELVQFNCACPIMQFIGLTDKNGVEIYESFIVKDHVGIGVVKYSEEHAAFRVVYGDGRAKWFIDYLRSERKSIEVIGSIHQNPELLEQNDE